MLIYANSKNRPFHYGQYPLEALPRDDAVIAAESARLPRPRPVRKAGEGLLAHSANRYARIYRQLMAGDPARARAPVPDDLERRAADVKASPIS